MSSETHGLLSVRSLSTTNRSRNIIESKLFCLYFLKILVERVQKQHLKFLMKIGNGLLDYFFLENNRQITQPYTEYKLFNVQSIRMFKLK